MGDGVFRFFNPTAPREDPKEKRRRQLRQAQKTFRGRKELYARTLEKELDRIRVSEAQLMTQCARLREEVESLTECLGRYGINSPLEGSMGTDQGSPPSAVAAVVHQHGDRSAAHTGSRTGGTDAWAEESPYQTFQGTEFGHHHPEDHSPSVCHSASPESRGGHAVHPTTHRGSMRVSDLDPGVVGMEFVLILEDPCRSHLHGDPDKPYDPTGHALTASARLLSVSALPRPELPPSGAGAGAGAGATVAAAAPPGLLDRLLQLSSDLAAENEVTPTQAWQYLRAQPRFADLELDRVYAFARQLRDIIKCRGFGGVLDVGIFRRAVFEYVGLGQLINPQS